MIKYYSKVAKVAFIKLICSDMAQIFAHLLWSGHFWFDSFACGDSNQNNYSIFIEKLFFCMQSNFEWLFNIVNFGTISKESI